MNEVRATRAYVAGLGTAGSLVAGAAVLFVLASAVVSFRGWPQVGAQPSAVAVVVQPSQVAAGSSTARRLLSAVAATRPAAPLGSASRSGSAVAGIAATGGRVTIISRPIGGGGGAGGGGGGQQGPPSGGGSGSGGTPPPGGVGGTVGGSVGGAVSSAGSNLGTTVTTVAGGLAHQVKRISPELGGIVSGAGQAVGGTISSSTGAAGSGAASAGKAVGGLLGGLTHH